MNDFREEDGRSVKYEKIDPTFKYEIMKMPGAGNIHLCFQCGTCSSDCAIARFSEFYNPRKLAHMTQFGLKNRLMKNDALWLCTTCHTCVDHCPQGVEISSLVRALRNLSFKGGNKIPILYKTFALSILKTGFAYKIPESRIKRREEQGLPSLPRPNLDQIANLFDATDFLYMLEKSETFKKVERRAGNI